MIKFRNFTPHAIKLNDGRIFESEGVARVAASFTEIEGDFCKQTFGDVAGMPPAQEGVVFIVSGIVFSATDRKDVVAPATGHAETVRNDKGHIVSVPCFISK